MRTAISLVIGLISIPLTADHAPEWLMSTAKPETTLMGISVESATLADVEKRFGKPSQVNRKPDFPNEGDYAWNKGDLTLSVATMFPDEPAGSPSEHVYFVRVRGDASIPAARTGAGVRLGDTLEKLISRYGSRYQTEYRKDVSGEVLTVVFVFSNETELAAGFSDSGTIISLQLTASVE